MLSFLNMASYLQFYCAPCLMNEKPANLFSMPLSIYKEGSKDRMLLQKKGFVLKTLYEANKNIHLILYSKNHVKENLARLEVKNGFSFFGYKNTLNTEELTNKLIKKMIAFGKKENKAFSFPHEIGLFLGYPSEDVMQYCLKKGKDYIFCGYWKVYTNPNLAKMKFKKYDECRAYCLKQGSLLGINELLSA